MLLLYIFIVPVILSLTVDCTFSSELKIKFYPFTFRVAKTASISSSKQDKTDTQKKIDFQRLLLAEYQTASLLAIVIGKFIKALFKSKRHYLKISLRGGFGAPDVTGLVFGLIESIRPAFGNRVTIAYYPDMVSGVLNCNLRTQAVVRMHSVLSETLFLITRLPLVKIVKIIIRVIKGDYNVRSTQRNSFFNYRGTQGNRIHKNRNR
jgi:hypothetical protein